MIWHWVGLAFFSITLLPAGAAMVAGRVPERLRPRLAPVRPRGWAVLALYAAAPLNTIPRLADASPAVVSAATAAAGLAAATGCAMTVVTSSRAARAAS